MLQTGKIKLRDIRELQAENVVLDKNNTLTPLKKRKNAKAITTEKKLKLQEHNVITVTDAITNSTNTITKTKKKISLKSGIIETPVDQKRIDSYFTSCPKNYEIKFSKKDTPFGKTQIQAATTKTKVGRSSQRKNAKSPRRPKPGRKRLFTDADETSGESPSNLSSIKENNIQSEMECIIIDSDSEVESNIKKEISKTVEHTAPDSSSRRKETRSLDQSTYASSNTDSSLNFGLRMSKTSCEKTKTTSKSSNSSTNVSKRKTKPCPSYKVIENTTFAVDAFQFGYIENVTHYFLTHFHADHYIGLTKSFAMPLYVSHITARLLRSFIPVEEQYIHEMDLNVSYTIGNTEITALDANHCPGSILLVFRNTETKECILHTGDFRAWHGMESEPIFWNYTINTIYLDTTYLSDKYNFCTQYESIEKAIDLIEKFNVKHAGKRILYICGSYIVGKENFWSALAEKYNIKVWAEGNRAKALKAINKDELNRLLVDDPHEANMHVVAMGKLTYLELIEYFKLYEHLYDIVFAMRPTGWEKNSKPRYGAKINLVGIEYSEHSSYKEMQRFVRFLKPEKVISTVPTGRDLMKTSKVPLNWYKYDKLKPESNYQPSIDSYLGKTPQRKSNIRMPNENKGGVDTFVSPFKTLNLTPNEINFAQDEEMDEIIAPKPATNLKNRENCNNSVTQIVALSSKNSTEDFESPDLVITSKKLPIKKEVLLKRDKLKKRNINIKPVMAINSDECFETPDIQLVKKRLRGANKVSPNKEKPAIKNSSNRVTRSKSKLSGGLTPASQYQTADSTTNHTVDSKPPAFSNYSSLISINNSKTLTNKVSLEKKSRDKLFKQNERMQETPVHKTLSNSTTDSTPDNKMQVNKEWLKHDSKISTSQKRTTKSKTNLRKTTKLFSSSYLNTIEPNDSLLNNEIELNSNTIVQEDCENLVFEKRTDRLNSKSSAYSSQDEFKNQSHNTKSSSLSCSKNQTEKESKDLIVNKLIINSPTYSMLSDEITTTKSSNLFTQKTKELQVNLPTCSQRTPNEFNITLKPAKSKKTASAVKHCKTPFKKAKSSLDTNTILNTILEHNEDIDRFNCSQLAGLVVEAVNKYQPDNIKNKDHIPADLLSDADDDCLSSPPNSLKQTPKEIKPLMYANELHENSCLKIQNLENPTPQKITARSITNTSRSTLSSQSENNQHDFKFSISQKRTTKSKTNSNYSLKSSTTSNQKRAEIKFTEKLIKISQENNCMINSHSPLKSTMNFSKSQVNPIFKTSTNSSIDSKSSDENPTTIQRNSLTNSGLTKSVKNEKSPSKFNSTLTSAKPTQPSLDSQAILNKILEQGDCIDRYNNSQLAGLVEEFANKQQSDNSKDHIPADLQSDADDDWI